MRVVICGGGVAGSAAALLLERRGHDVTVFERDRASAPRDVAGAWQDWQRPGVGQFRQFHGFTAQARKVLAQDLPDVHADLLEAGVTERPMSHRIGMLFPDSTPEESDAEIVGLRGRRTTFEWVLRRALERSGVTIRLGTPVDGVVRTGRGVGGVRC